MSNDITPNVADLERAMLFCVRWPEANNLRVSLALEFARHRAHTIEVCATCLEQKGQRSGNTMDSTSTLFAGARELREMRNEP